MTFGLWLRDHRLQRHLTQTEAAAHLEISAQYYHDLERGRRDPSERVLLALSHAWSIPYIVLCLRAGYAPNSMDISGATDATLESAWSAFMAVLEKGA